MNKSRPNKKIIVGTVVSDKTDKTVTVELETRKRHPLYKKFVKTHSKVKAHDAKNEAMIGDLVRMIEVRPLSKEKTWRVTDIVEKAQK
ncbi:MAG: 30S ribosomal protein S17 [Candidatus Omnitrophica bacterium]|nr:30S ribosomal protein S17 [Candidatus Omnitrophota bacterium]